MSLEGYFHFFGVPFLSTKQLTLPNTEGLDRLFDVVLIPFHESEPEVDLIFQRCVHFPWVHILLIVLCSYVVCVHFDVVCHVFAALLELLHLGLDLELVFFYEGGSLFHILHSGVEFLQEVESLVV